MSFVDEAKASGVAKKAACAAIGLPPRTVERWRYKPCDGRVGRRTSPSNKLSCAERRRIVKVATSPTYRDQPVKPLVAKLADAGTYIGSESTVYRVLKSEELAAPRRGRVKAPKRKRPRARRAKAPNQVWAWDISYLPAARRGTSYRLYLALDVWSRKVVGWRVEDHESSKLAADLVSDACKREGASPFVMHMDNGAAMTGSSLLALLQWLGTAASFSRPSTPSDNPFAESAFRTLKYRPDYPAGRFASLEAARDWVKSFVHWYNNEHLHSGIGMLTPASRHDGHGDAILKRRQKVWEAARRRNPERWTRKTKHWSAPDTVWLNPDNSIAHAATAS
jgi:putative transposase